MPLASDYLAARRHNDRSRLDRHWGGVVPKWTALIVRRLLLGLDENDLDDKLLDWTWAHLTQATWTVSAHLPDKDLPAGGLPVLDLASCERSMQFAEMREVLLPWIESVSGVLAERIVYEIDTRILTPYAEGVRVWWDEREFSNNWLGVCAGSILAACCSLEAQGQARPEAKARAVKGLQKFFRDSFTPGGECDEGIGYWAYGVGFACHGLSRLTREEFQSAFDPDRFRLIADYPRRAHLFDNCFYCGNDGGMRASADHSFIPWLSEAAGSPWLADFAREYPARHAARLGQALRILEAPDLGAPTGSLAPATTEPVLLEDQQAAILRAAGGRLVANFSGGNNAENHNHNDLGHFVVACDGRVIVPDLGAPKYTSDFFGPNRYTYLSASSRGHCCPIVGGHEQRAGKEAAGEIVAWKPPGLALQLASAYPPEAGLKSWERSMQVEGDGFALRDAFETDSPDVEILHVLWSTEPVSEKGGEIQLGPLRVTFDPPPEALRIEQVNGADHGLRYYADKALYRIEAAYKTDKDGALTVATTIQ